jgi:hypothetical protein
MRDRLHESMHVTPFPEDSGRVLLTLNDDRIESWTECDPSQPIEAQHTELEQRTRRFFKVRMRHLLNALVQAREWAGHLDRLRRSIEAVGYQPDAFAFDRLTRQCVTCTAPLMAALPRLIEEARVVGFVNEDDATALLCGDTIDETMDPRPANLAAGPPIVLERVRKWSNE